MSAKQPSVVRRIEQHVDQVSGAAANAISGALTSVVHAAGGVADDMLGGSRQARYVLYLLKRAREDQLAQVAGSLTFTTLLSLVPFLTIALGVFAAFPIFDEMRYALEKFLLDNVLPEQASDAVMTHVGAFAQKAAGLTMAGVLALGVTAILLLQTIDRALNAIWRVPRPRPLGQRVLVYWTVVTLGPVLIGGGLVLTSLAVSVSLGFMPGSQFISHLLLAVVPLLLTALAFAILYVAVPNRDVQWRHAAIGGVAAALGFEAMKNLFGLYVASFPSYQLIYGAFAAIPIFLLWIYMSWLVTLGGGLIAATWPLVGYERADTHKWPGLAFTGAMRILFLLHRSRTSGGATPRRIRAELRTGFSDSETLLEGLRHAGWVARVEGTDGQPRWAMLADPDALLVAEVFRRFAFDAGMAARTLGADDAQQSFGVARLSALIEGSLDLTLAQAFAAGPAVSESHETPADKRSA